MSRGRRESISLKNTISNSRADVAALQGPLERTLQMRAGRIISFDIAVRIIRTRRFIEADLAGEGIIVAAAIGEVGGAFA